MVTILVNVAAAVNSGVFVSNTSCFKLGEYTSIDQRGLYYSMLPGLYRPYRHVYLPSCGCVNVTIATY